MVARAIDAGHEPVGLDALAGRALAEPVTARSDHPSFTNSAMDGYGVRAADAAGGAPQRLVGESRAGAPFAGSVGPGEAVRISTGAEVPDGVDAILRREDSEERDGSVVARVAPPAGAFVRRRGEDVAGGDALLPAGHRIAAHEVAVVAAAGRDAVLCRRRPRVAVLGSGDEVRPAGSELAPGQVYDANRPGIAAQARAAGAEVVVTALIPDDRAATVAALRAAFDPSGDEPPHLVVTIGGVSVGRHDHLRPALEEVGVREILFGVQIRPGHPLWLGAAADGRLVIGLPGNPVSAAVCFHAFGRPLLGRDDDWTAELPLAEPYAKDTPRTELVRCAERGGALVPLPRQGSHAVTSLAGATHLAVVPAERSRVAAGERLRACRLSP
jgi:molybdopterin molybdotransferase